MNSIRRHERWLSGWLVPILYAAAALVLGLFLPRIELRLWPDLVSSVSVPAAMAICSAIASGMIALTGIVFSLRFLMVQFSGQAYSPRLVLWVVRDRVVSHALGMFIATFLYALVLIAWIDRNTSGRVPFVSGWLGIALLVISMGWFLALVDRVGLLQVSRMLIFTGDRGRQAIEEMYPSSEAAAGGPAPDVSALPVTQTLTHVGRPRTIQALDTASLVRLASGSDAVIEIVAAVGDTVTELTPLLRVHGASRSLDENGLRKFIVVGRERTFEQDPNYAIRLIVDIAIRALSPAVNDPTTTVQALDQVEDLLCRLGRRRMEKGTYFDGAGALRLLVPFPAWEASLRLGLDEILFYGASSVQVMRRMNALIKHLTAVLPADRHPALRGWEQALQRSVAKAFADDEARRAALVADRQGLGLGR